MQTFVQRYQRTSRRDGDPNDRRYDKDTERAVAQMKPEEFDRLLRDDED